MLLKVSDLVFKTVLLIQILESGAPVVIVVIFTAVVVFNALACTLIMFVRMDRPRLVQTLADLLYGLILEYNFLLRSILLLLLRSTN